MQRTVAYDHEGWGLERVQPYLVWSGIFWFTSWRGGGGCVGALLRHSRAVENSLGQLQRVRYEQLGELIKGFVFDAGRLGVVRDVEIFNPI